MRFLLIHKYIRFTIGIAIGLLLAVVLFVAYTIFFSYENPSEKRLAFALNQLDQEQKRLGIRCLDGDKFLLSYIDAVGPVIEKLVNGERLSESHSIIALGSKAFDMMNTCARLKMMIETDNHDILGNLALGDHSAQVAIAKIRLAVSRTSAPWCDVGCIQAARKEILENSSLVRQRLVSTNVRSIP